jgi:hypothetical protein
LPRRLLLQAQECENLMRVVRELTASRSKLVAGKSIMAERFAELQVGALLPHPHHQECVLCRQVP